MFTNLKHNLKSSTVKKEKTKKSKRTSSVPKNKKEEKSNLKKKLSPETVSYQKCMLLYI